MNEPAKKTLGRYLADTITMAVALLFAKRQEPKAIDTDWIMERMTDEHRFTRNVVREVRDSVRQLRSIVFACWFIIFGLQFWTLFSTNEQAINTTPAPVNIPVVMYTKGTSWEKGYLDSAGVNRSYHDGHDLGQINGWMKP